MRKLAPVVGHAATKMHERGITHWEAEFVLNNFDIDMPAEIVGARLLIGNVGERRVGIVVLPLGDEIYRLCSTWAKGE